MTSILIGLLSLTGCVLVMLWFYIQSKWKALERWGIPHTKPTIKNLGHMKNILLAKEKIFSIDAQMKKKLGPVWGYYAGVTPHIVVHEPDILRELFIKEFSNYPRRRNQFLKVSGEYLNNSVNNISGSQWKRIRSTLSPSFSSGKLKQMTSIVTSCTQKTISILKQAENGLFNPKRVIGDLTLDVICSAAFGVKLDISSHGLQEEHKIITMSKKFRNITFRSPKLLLLFLFPWLENYTEFLNISIFPAGMMNYYAAFINAVIKQRKDPSTSSKRVDLMQLMIDVEVDKIDVHSTKGLVRNEIIGNAILMLIAGNDTTESTIIFLLYNLATHPEIQEKLIKEVDELVSNEGDLTYENVNNIKLLDLCIKETLRMFAPTLRNARCGLKDMKIKGHFFPGNVAIDIPLYEIHHNPDVWDEPEEFRPERFEDMSSINPMHYHPFGAGPRHCIGMRFALMEIKLVACLLLSRFKFERDHTLTPKPPLKPVFKTLVQPPDMELKAILREI